MDKIFGLKKNVFWLGLVSLFNDFSAEMVQSVMPVFLTSVLGAPVIFVGFIDGFADALASFLKIFSGWFSDKIKRRKLPAVLGYILSVGVRPFLAVVSSYWQVFGLRVVDRIGKGFRDAPRDALISESVAADELGKSFGYHRMMDTIGATVGPLVAFLVLPLVFNNYRFLFLIAFLIGLFSLLSFFFVKDSKKEDVLKKQKLDFSLFKRNKKFSWFILTVFIFGLSSLPISLLLLRAPAIGLNIAQVPLFYFIFSLSFVFVSLPLGRLSDKIGQRKVISFGFFAALVAYLGFILSQSFFALALMFVILGFYSAATDGVSRALAAKLIEPDLIATGQGLLNAANGFSALIAGLIGGSLWNFVSAEAAFGYAAFMSFIGLILFVVLTKPSVKMI
jgi:MFS family permease